MLHGVISALTETPHDWSDTNFIIKYRDIFSMIDKAIKDVYIPQGIIEKYTDDQCAAGITYLLGKLFDRYHSVIQGSPEEPEEARLNYRGLLDKFMKRAD